MPITLEQKFSMVANRFDRIKRLEKELKENDIKFNMPNVGEVFHNGYVYKLTSEDGIIRVEKAKDYDKLFAINIQDVLRRSRVFLGDNTKVFVGLYNSSYDHSFGKKINVEDVKSYVEEGKLLDRRVENVTVDFSTKESDDCNFYYFAIPEDYQIIKSREDPKSRVFLHIPKGIEIVKQILESQYGGICKIEKRSSGNHQIMADFKHIFSTYKEVKSLVGTVLESLDVKKQVTDSLTFMTEVGNIELLREPPSLQISKGKKRQEFNICYKWDKFDNKNHKYKIEFLTLSVPKNETQRAAEFIEGLII